jgi:hypothetical protein
MIRLLVQNDLSESTADFALCLWGDSSCSCEFFVTQVFYT